MENFTLSDLGWSASFARQAPDGATPARVSTIHRDRLEALSPEGPLTLVTPDSTGDYAVGDWVLHASGRVLCRLERATSIRRRAAGEAAREQLIAANVDTLAIVTSCNADYNEARLERYLSLAAAGGALPLIILTKADLADDPGEYLRRAQRLSPLAMALTIDAREAEDARRLDPWCRDGRTLALVGSSGVGKTTLQNVLTGTSEAVQGIRDDDAKGRHTTTNRALRRTLAGGWLIDTPGMRELRIADAAAGIGAVFADIEDLAAACRFGDCGHESEPGCAVQAAIAAGDLEPVRLNRWRKLLREDAYNSETVAEARARARTWRKSTRDGRLRSQHKREV